MQTRTLSYSDDNVSVKLPQERGNSTKPSFSTTQNSLKTILGLRSLQPAIDLFRLRQIQSRWYTDLFQSGRTPWNDPYPYVWESYHALTKWFDSIDASTPEGIKHHFQLELLYSFVYILSPSPRIPSISDYARKLLFEHSVAYSEAMVKVVLQENTQ